MFLFQNMPTLNGLHVTLTDFLKFDGDIPRGFMNLNKAFCIMGYRIHLSNTTGITDHQFKTCSKIDCHNYRCAQSAAPKSREIHLIYLSLQGEFLLGMHGKPVDANNYMGLFVALMDFGYQSYRCALRITSFWA